jgi:hypothetical protein
MSVVPEVRNLIEPIDPTVRAEQDSPRVPGGITTGFNVTMIMYLAIPGIWNFMFLSEKAKGVPLEGLIVSCALDVVRFLAALLITALILEAFWHRLIAPLFTIRPITYQEAIAVVLMISILFHA